MKKILLSLLVIASFGIYSYTQKAASQDTPGVIKAPVIPETQNQPVVTYRDGKYKGKSIDAYYGNVQVGATIEEGKLTSVNFLEYPNTRQTSERINGQAMPYLIQEAIQSQKAEVDIVSGATQTSKAFRESLKTALLQASE